MRSVLSIVGVFAIGLVLTESAVLAFFWSQGQLDRHTLREIGDLVQGKTSTASATDEAEPDHSVPSIDEVIKNRSLRILELQTRETELNLLKRTVLEHRENLISEQQLFEKQKEQFKDELEKELAQASDDATEQARSVLLAMEPANAVDNLMQLDLPKNVVLVQGMPEKKIAEILEQFRVSPDAAQQTRGFEIFEALTLGSPVVETIAKELDQLADRNTTKTK